MQDRIAYQGITFDDVLLEPGYSDVVPRDVDVRTLLTRNIRLNLPILSSPMDTVTESDLAIALAQEGGIGIIHKNLSVPDQTREVDKVKRSENGIITDPITLPPDESVGTARRIMEQNKISGVPVTVNGFLKGILTRRDLRFLTDNNQRIAEVMTRDNLVTATENTTLEAAERILTQNKVEKLLLVDDKNKLKGLITIKDIDKLTNFPNACKDARGRLRVGAAVGVHDYERAESLIRAGVDVLVVDSAHGHSANVLDTVAELKRSFTIDVIAGNVATAEGAQALVEAGADAVKVGIGPGSICTTRIISGVGVPQITAIYQASRGVAGGVPIIADGGIRYSGDVSKALAAGAHSVMLGSLLAGLAESPGQTIIYKGRSFKTYRGMGSLGAMVAGSKDRYRQDGGTGDKLVPEGVEGRVPYKGPLGPFVYQLIGGLRAGMGYCGTRNIEELRTRTRFILVSAAAVQESHPHDIAITQEAPNYSSRAEYVAPEVASLAVAALAIWAGLAPAQAPYRDTLPPPPTTTTGVVTMPAAPASSGVAYIPNTQPATPPPQPLTGLAATAAPLPPPPAYPQTWTAAPSVEQTRFQPESRPGAPGGVPLYRIQLEPPGLEGLAQSLQTEEALRERIRQENRARNIMDVTFPESPVLSTDVYNGRAFEPRKITVAPNYVVYRRLLFQQLNFERYGWDLGLLGSPLSAMAFLWDFALLPYNLGTDPYRCMDSNAGYCLPGDPVPLLLYPPELSLTGAALEVGTILALVAVLP